MRRLHVVLNWVRQLVTRGRFEREMQMEMDAHIVQEAALQRARGLSEDDALQAARREFGNMPLLQEQSRDAIGTRVLNDTVRDVRYAVRSLRRTPGFTIVALLSLTVGIGANTALFTFFKTIWAPPHVRVPETFVSWNSYLTYPGWRAVAAEPGLFSKTVVRADAQVAVVREGTSATRAQAELVSDGYFSMYDGTAMLGRVLVQGEGDSGQGILPIVLSNKYWRREFGSDSTVVGRNLRLANGTPLKVVGVMPRVFTGAALRSPDFWLPLSAREFLPDERRGNSAAIAWISVPDEAWLQFSAQLEKGMTVQRAELRLQYLFAHLNTADSISSPNFKRRLITAHESKVDIRTIGSISVIMLATLFVLLIGCANVANLVLARGVRRRREIAVRMSLGASRARLVRQLMTESVLLALVGGTAALALSAISLRIVSTSAIILTVLEGSDEIFNALLKPSATVIVFTYAVAFISAAACGLLPALRSTKMDLSSATKDDGRDYGHRLSRSKLRTGLIVGQVALSLVLLISASVMAHSASNGAAMDVGFDKDHLTVLQASASENDYTVAQQVEFGRLSQGRVSSIVNPVNVARGSIPVQEISYVRIDPKGAERKSTAVALASPNYFDVLGITLRKGRKFTDLEARNSADVAVVSEATVQRFWPTIDPIGQQLKLARPADKPTPDSLRETRTVTVVGVAANAQMTGLGDTPRSMIYLPTDTGSFLIRTADGAPPITRQLREAAHIVDANVVVSARMMDDVIAQYSRLLGAQMVAWFAGTLGIVALALSALGIFGVVAYAVSQRTRELGVRLAIGAQSTDVVVMVMKQGMKPVVVGALLGLGGGALATRAVRNMMFGVTGVDPLSYGVAASIVCAAACVACYIPARRATRIDPVNALRSE